MSASFSDPKKILSQFDVHEAMLVADIGAGSGHYTFELAKRVGTGKVYAIDIQKDLLARIKNNALQVGLTNIEIILGDCDQVYGTTLKDSSVNRVILSNTLFQFENKEVAIEEIKRILKPGGKVLVIDWSESFDNLGPTASHIFTRSQARSLFEKVGFYFERDIIVGAHHYGIILRR
jgi:ubiquinone/menaquinone biosynthesis C-methylase UbiE